MQRKLRYITTVVVGTLAFLSVAAVPASGVTATGCSGKASSTVKDGTVLDEVSAPGSGGTRSDPFVVDHDGTVTWSGETSSVIKNGTWIVKAWPTSISGRIGNESAITTKSGVDKVKDRLKVKLPGLYFVKVSLKGSDGASCVAQGWVKINGKPAFTPVWIAALVSILLGLGGWVALLKRLLGFGRRAARIGASS